MFKVTCIAPRVFLSALAIFAPLATLAEDYPIGVGDQLDISVFARPDLSRIYQVRPDGTISLHIVGAIDAAGKGPAELEADVEARLAQEFSGPESATLEVAAYRPIVVSGDVSTPGSVPFSHGIDVRSAVAMAGGLGGGPELETTGQKMRVEDEVAAAALHAARLASLEVTRARLIAARSGEAEPDLPAMIAERLADAPDPALIDAARSLLEAREAERSVRDAALTGQARLAGDEATAFADRRTLLEDQLESLVADQAEQEDLRARGLTTGDRLFDLTESADRTRADILETIALEAAARQKLERAGSATEEERIQQRALLSEALAETEAELLQTRIQLRQSQAFVRTFGGPSRLADGPGRIAYRVHRRSGDTTETIEVDPDTRLRPGDVLDIATDMEQSP